MPDEESKTTAENEESKAEKKKKPKSNGELDKLKAELESKSDLLMRTAAEFDNFKKRTERERASVAEYAKASVVKKLLPILDNIDRANAADKASEDYLKGVEMIIKQFGALAEDLNLETIGAAGESFDPNLHDAVMHIEDEALGENVIAEVLQKGYKLGDTVVRPAIVKVAN